MRDFILCLLFVSLLTWGIVVSVHRIIDYSHTHPGVSYSDMRGKP